MKSRVLSSLNQDYCLVFFVILLSLFLSSAFPLFTYGTSLALFGLAHVASELRFVDQRFAPRIGPRYGILLAFLLLGIIAARSALVFKLVPANLAYYGELSVVFLLILSVFYKIPLSNFRSTEIALGIVATILLGIFISPTLTLLIFTVFHNLTPMGFIVELVPAPRKRVALIVCASVFFLLPLLVFLGALTSLITFFGIANADFSFLPLGPLANNLSVFIPASLLKTSFAVNAFSAVVFAQCMHYVAVIYVMPRLLVHYHPSHTNSGFFPWPTNKIFWTIISGLSIVLATFYWSDFFKARAFYGIAAAVHSYIELPILLFAFLAKESATKVCPPALRLDLLQAKS